ncbi:amidase [Nonomuraea sp. NPDC050790]|uniref:amidase n=1 Tax=Nonomuraea sp. NPDC050790 TaxID=3364371 RepID=UPI0037A476B5
MDEILRLDAVGQALAVRDGRVSPRELAEAAIAKIVQYDGEIGAVVHRRFERALAEADDLPEGTPFRGVPILLKDLGWPEKGEPYNAGSRTLDGVTIAADGYGVAKLKAAGFVILGRTSTPEYGTTITTEPAAFGPTRNPYDPGHSAGGSSGGSAAAVAAGMVAVATASDGGGSIRIPASLCGLVGLKPTKGRSSYGPSGGEGWSGFSVAGLVSRTVRDTAAVLDLISGLEEGDPYTAPALPRPLAQEVGAEPGRLRVGFVTRHPRGDVPEDKDLTAAVTDAAHLLESLGHHVEPGHPDELGNPDFPHHFGALVAANVAAEVQSVGAWRGRPVSLEELEPRNRAMAEAGARRTAVEHVLAVQWMDGFRRRMAAWWRSGYDVLLAPALGVPPFPLGWLPPDDLSTSLGRTSHAVSYTSVFNATGQPAVCLPLHRTAAGLPVGVQLVAATGREDLLVRLAAQIETARPFEHPAMR